MTTFQTCCNKLLAAMALASFGSAAAAHSVHSQLDAQHLDTGDMAQVEQSVDSLLEQYSLHGNDEMLMAARRQLPPTDAPASVGELLQAAWLAQADHEFDHARRLLMQILAQQPNSGQAWLLEAAIADVVGDSIAARHACGKVVLSVSPEAGVVCFGSLADTVREKRIAHDRIKKLPAPTSDSRLTAWRWSVHAQLARDLGLPAEAEELFQRAIGIFPAVQTRATLMDLYLQQERYDEVLSLSSERAAAPALAVRRLLAQRGMGVDISATVAQFDQRFQTWLAADDYRHAREMAMFYLDLEPRADLAFRVAQINATLQKEPEDIALLNRAWVYQQASRDI